MGNIHLISVVDDDDSVRESLQRLIRSVGFGAQAFASAEDFLNSDHLCKTDCLILDVRMPRMNGIELQRRLVASHHEIPIIFITAHGDKAAHSQALKNGAVDYLLKPFSEELLLNAIRAALGRDEVERNRNGEKHIEIDQKESRGQIHPLEKADESGSTHTTVRNKVRTNASRLFLWLMKRWWRYALLRSFRHARASALIYRALAECEIDEIRNSMLIRLAKHAEHRANAKACHLRKLGTGHSTDRDPPASRALRWLLVRFGIRSALAWIHRVERRDLVLSVWLVGLTARVAGSSHFRALEREHR